MVTRNASRQASALAKARQRRRALDRVRDEHDQRVEDATASVLVALDARADAERALESATGRVGQALKALLGEDVGMERAAALVELELAEVRRLVKVAPAEADSSAAKHKSPVTVTLSDVPGGPGAESPARRAG